MSFHILRFNRSAAHYESEAGIQDRMAGRLLELWEGPAPGGILEFGCGTGLLTRRLLRRFPTAYLLATDAAPNMLAEARSRCAVSQLLEFVEQDADGSASASPAVLSHAPFDLIASNGLVQWFPRLEAHLRFAFGVAASNAAYLLSGFSRSNFPELNALLAEPPFSYETFPGQDPDAVENAAASAGWNVPILYSWEEKEVLPSPRHVLHRLQALGSTRDPREGGRLNRKSLSHLVWEYSRRFSESGGVRVTWKPWIALLRRRL